ncbi:hypothetical protein BKA70DRAFT_1242540 [Coprinopsis sp. MPI-PUGE-AT-0042]|nr:hypothetical protein BKA70DRAFT_1242540 [Coprinopsis sp. MPI-PUGE-AT-0042]
MPVPGWSRRQAIDAYRMNLLLLLVEMIDTHDAPSSVPTGCSGSPSTGDISVSKRSLAGPTDIYNEGKGEVSNFGSDEDVSKSVLFGKRSHPRTLVHIHTNSQGSGHKNYADQLALSVQWHPGPTTTSPETFEFVGNGYVRTNGVIWRHPSFRLGSLAGSSVFCLISHAPTSLEDTTIQLLLQQVVKILNSRVGRVEAVIVVDFERRAEPQGQKNLSLSRPYYKSDLEAKGGSLSSGSAHSTRKQCAQAICSNLKPRKIRRKLNHP